MRNEVQPLKTSEQFQCLSKVVSGWNSLFKNVPLAIFFGGPNEKIFTVPAEPQYGPIEISIEQLGKRVISIHTMEKESICNLHYCYLDLKCLLMLLDGRFFPIESAVEDGGEITAEIQKELLPYYDSADFMLVSNNCLIEFDKVLSKTLYKDWIEIQEELDIIHNMVLYILSSVKRPVDMKCAFLIEAFSGVGEIIQKRNPKFGLPTSKNKGESLLGIRLEYMIKCYGKEIFQDEHLNLDGFVQRLVDIRNRIAHIKSKQGRKYLNGNECVLYLSKLSLMYRCILLDLLNIPLSMYQERLSVRIESIKCLWKSTIK